MRAIYPIGQPTYYSPEALAEAKANNTYFENEFAAREHQREVAGKRPSTSTDGPAPKVQVVEAETSGAVEESGIAEVDEEVGLNDGSEAAEPYEILNSSEAEAVQQDIEMGLPGTGQGAGGAGDGNANGKMPIYSPERPMSMFGKKISTYKKVHRFMTFAIAPTFISKNLTTPVENQRWLTTGLASIPWEFPFLYLNQSEFDLIPPGSRVREVRIKICHRGNRIAFETGEVATRLATLNQIQDVMVAFGLNKTGWGTDVTYPSFVAGNPMVPTNIAAPVFAQYDEILYGYPNSDANFATVIPTHQLGIPLPLPNYFNVVTATQAFGGIPPISEHITFYDGKTTIDQPLANFKYVPKMGMIKAPLKHIRSGLPLQSSGLTIQTNGNLVSGRQAVINEVSKNATGSLDTVTEGSLNISNNTSVIGTFSIFDAIEKSQTYRSGQWGQYEGAQIQPSIHIGVQAIPSLSSTGILLQVSNWTDAQASWDVVCEMDVEEYQPTKLPYATAANVPAGKVVYRVGNVLPSDDNCTYAGLYPNEAIRGI